MTAGSLNRASQASYANGPMQFSDFSDGQATWIVPWVRVTQVRTQKESMTAQQLVCCGTQHQLPTLNMVKRVPRFTKDCQETAVRSFPSGYTELYTENRYNSVYGKQLEAPDIPLMKSGQMQYYPGRAGHSLSGPSGSYNMYHGVWVPSAAQDQAQADSFKTAVEADLAFMKSNRWIDAQSALVQVGCCSATLSLLRAVCCSLCLTLALSSCLTLAVGFTAGLEPQQQPSTTAVLLGGVLQLRRSCGESPTGNPTQAIGVVSCF